MRTDSNRASAVGEPIYTLAQNGTESGGTEAAIITGNGTELGNERVLKGRARRKMITLAMAFNLIKIAESRGDNQKLKSFWNTYYCQNRVVSVGGRMYGKYCKNRYCTLCCSIRKAEIINKYYPILREWDEPYFVTLTVRSPNAKNLRPIIKKMIEGFQRITSKYRKQQVRGKGLKLMGIRSLECTFNHAEQTYHPHIHVIVANKEMGDLLITEWLKLWKPKYALRQCQDIRKAQNIEAKLIELIKYGSKIFTEPDITNRWKNRDNSTIYAAALYNIFVAMEGIRIFERFGFNLPKVTKEIQGARIVRNYGEWLFIPKHFDWLNTDNELTLSGYCPPDGLVNLLRYNVDRQTE
jgi:Replication protein